MPSFSFIACWISGIQSRSLGFLVGFGFEDDSNLADLTRISFSFCIPLSRKLKDSASPFTEEIILKSLDPLRAKKTFTRKKLGHTMVLAIKASSVTL